MMRLAAGGHPGVEEGEGGGGEMYTAGRVGERYCLKSRSEKCLTSQGGWASKQWHGCQVGQKKREMRESGGEGPGWAQSFGWK